MISRLSNFIISETQNTLTAACALCCSTHGAGIRASGRAEAPPIIIEPRQNAILQLYFCDRVEQSTPILLNVGACALSHREVAKTLIRLRSAATRGRDEAMSKSGGNSKQRVWIGAGVLLLAALIAAWFALPVKEWIETFQEWIKGLGAWGVLAFAAVYIVAVVLLVPASALTVAAGSVFGAWGFPLVVVAATIGAGLAFLIARYLAKARVKKFVDKRPKLKAVDQAVAEDGWKIVGLLRLSPLVPFGLQNYLFGITEIGFYPYLGTTFVGIMPGSLLYVLLGTLGHDDGGNGAVWKWSFFGVGIVATAITGVIITRKAKAKLAESGVGKATKM